MRRRYRKPQSSKTDKRDPFIKPAVQKKLKMGQRGDTYEVEADRMADAVVNKTEGNGALQKMEGEEEVQQKPLASSVTPWVQRMAGSEEEPVQQITQEEEPVQQITQEEEPVQQITQEEEPVQQMTQEEEPVQQMTQEEEPVQQVGEEEEPLQQVEEEEAVQRQEDEQMSHEEEEAIRDMKVAGEIPVQHKLEDEKLQAKSIGNKKATTPTLGEKLKKTRGKGNRLDTKTKMVMEQGFGTDFSEVNIHTDNEAIQMSQELGAQAFTHGKDIYFNEGKFNPNDKVGKHLLAHELTHTIQQGASTTRIQKQERRGFRPRRVSRELLDRLMAPDSPLWRELNPNVQATVNCPATAAAVDTYLSTGNIEAAPSGDSFSSFEFSTNQFSDSVNNISQITRRLRNPNTYAVVRGIRSTEDALAQGLTTQHYFTIVNYRDSLKVIDAFGRGGVSDLASYLANDQFQSYSVSRGRLRVRHVQVDLSDTTDPTAGIE